MGSGVLRKNDWEWLRNIRDGTDTRTAAGYPWWRVEDIPTSVAQRLRQRRGVLIEKWFPNNPAHKPCWVITRKGRRALADHDPQEEADDGN